MILEFDKSLAVETRECKDCVNSLKQKDLPWWCGKKSMTICSDMKVTFVIKKGTCWAE